MKGVYSRFLTNLTPARFAQRFDQVINHFYDFAPLTVAPNGAAGARFLRKGMPLCIAEWWAVVTIPFVKVPLEASGARAVGVEWRATPAGVQQGTAVGDVVCEVTWRAEEAPAYPDLVRSARTSLATPLRVSNTPGPLAATASNTGSLLRTSSFFISSTEATLGRSRLLSCRT
jgi:hypothetical protein